MSAKDCGNHSKKRQRLYRRLFAGLIAFIVLILFVILVIWLVLRPSKPRFVLQDASAFQFNASSPNLLTTNLQVTIYSRNPNDKIGIYYDKLDVYASYRNQQITPPTVLPSTYQGHEDVNIWSPFLQGSAVPVAPYLAASINQDKSNGFIILSIKISGRLRWKVGSWTSDHYHIFVSCPAFMSFAPNAFSGADPVRLQQGSSCKTDV